METVANVRVSPTDDRSQWLAARRTGLGGSDLAAVLGLSPWRTPMDVWLEKTGRSEGQDESEAMLWGSLLEDVVAREYARRNSVRVERVNRIIRHGSRPFLGNIDRAVTVEGRRPVVGEEFRTDRILECKTSNAFAARDWGAPGTQEIPVHYAIQCLHYLALTGTRFCDVAVLIGGSDYRQYTVEADAGVTGRMWEQAERWWVDHVRANQAPAPVTEAEAAALFPESRGQQVAAAPDVLAAVTELATLKAWLKQAGEREQALRDRVCAVLGEGEALVAPDGRILATWKSTRGTAATDWEALARALNPGEEMVQRFTRIRPGYRRFTIKGANRHDGNGNGQEG